MEQYWGEFLKVAVAHLLAVASPGPDFAIVLRQSVTSGRRPAIWTSLGIGTAILLHVSYSLLGLGLLGRGSTVWFNVVKYVGAAYIAWLGLQSLLARPVVVEGAPHDQCLAPGEGRARGAYLTGFLTCALNPKASLFFISLFAMVVDPRTPKLIQTAYGIWMALMTAAWFSFVSVLFTQEPVRLRFLRHGYWIDRALGVVFLALAISLALSSLR